MNFKRIIILLLMTVALSALFVGCNNSSGGGNKMNAVIVQIRNENNALIDEHACESKSGNYFVPPDKQNGRTFLGFYSVDGTQYFDRSGRQIVDFEGDITLFYRFENEECGIILNADGGKVQGSASLTVTYGEYIGSLPVAEKEGYVFMGWQNYEGLTLTNDKGELYSDFEALNSFYKLNAQNQATLTASYRIRTFTVTLDYANANVNRLPETRMADYDEILRDLPTGDLGNGVMIVGWSPYMGASTRDAFTDFGPITSDVTLYAIVTRYKYVSLVFTEQNVKEVVLREDENVYVLPQGESCVEENPGYNCIGWYKSSTFSGGSRVDSAYFNDTVSTFFAEWELANYSVTLLSEDGSPYAGGSCDFTYTIESPAKDLPLPEERDELYFIGWTDEKGNIYTDVIPSGSYGTLVLTATWKRFSTKVDLYIDDNIFAIRNIDYKKPFFIAPPDFADARYFVYWYVLSDGEVVPLTDGEGNSLGVWESKADSAEVYCEYLSEGTVTLKYQRTDSDEYELKETRYIEGQEVNLLKPRELNAYEVRGWYISGVLVSDSAIYSFTMPDHDVTVELKYSAPLADFTVLGNEVYKYNGHLYAIIAQEKAWEDAEALCELYGGHLVTITSEEEQSFVADIVRKNRVSGHHYYIGFTDKETEGEWKWVTGERAVYTNWAGDEPNGGTNESYAVFYENYTAQGNYGWVDVRNYNCYFVCEWESENKVSVESKTVVDLNGDEKTLEILRYNGHYYAAVTDKMDWKTAEHYAEAMGGHLVTIADADENAFVNALRKSAGAGDAYIGWTDYSSEGNWQWVTGEPVDYINWAANQPDNSNNEDFGHFYTAEGGWNDLTGTAGYGFIVEWESRSDIGVEKPLLFGTVEINSASEINKLKLTLPETTIVLNCDIDLNGTAWEPTDLFGTFDGNGHAISGLDDRLFVNISGTVRNVRLDVEITKRYPGNDYVGAVCGTANNGAVVDNVEVNGALFPESNHNVGGLIGYVNGRATVSVTDCINNASVSLDAAEMSIGGIIGYVYEGVSITFENNVNNGAVTGIQYNAGGLIGATRSAFTVKNCVNSGAVSGVNCIGGLVGNSASGTITFDGCGSFGKVSGTNHKRYLGNGNASYVDLLATKVSSAEDLEELKIAVPADVFELDADIDMTGVNWQVIDFAATLDGKDHEIVGYTCDTGDTYCGFIKNLSGTIKNIRFRDITLNSTVNSSSSSYCGLIVHNTSGVIDNVEIVSGSITSVTAETGAICALINSAVTVTNCVNRAAVTSVNNTTSRDYAGTTGGIVGWISGGAPTIEGNKNYGAITGTIEVGGIIGGSASNVTLKNCENYGAVSGKQFVAGIIGSMRSGVTIDGCVSDIDLITATSDFGKYAAGAGTANYINLPTVEISSAEELSSLRGAVAADAFELTESIDLTDVGWTPFEFAGTLDGKGNAISGLTERLFTNLRGQVKDITLNVNVTGEYNGADYVGAVCGVAYSGAKLEGVTVNGVVYPKGCYNVGGLIGYVEGSANVSVTGCTNNAAVSLDVNEMSIGGMIGYVYNNAVLTFENNVNNGAVTHSGYNAGGFIGVSRATFTVKNCVNSGTVSGDNLIAGIIANAASGTVIIDGCSSLGEIIGEFQEKYVGSGNATYVNLPTVYISSAADMRHLKNAVAAEKFEFTADVDMKDVSWSPCAFAGTLDGKDHVIRNLTLSSASEDLALFYALTGTVSDLVFENVDITSTSFAKVGIATLAVESTGTVRNVTVASGTITGDVCDAAGIIARQRGGIVENCVNYATISGTTSDSDGGTGGIVELLNAGTVKDCVNYGEVSGKKLTAGVVADMGDGTIVTGCTNYGKVTGGGNYTAGVVGSFHSGGISNLTNEGEVVGKGDYTAGVIASIFYQGGDMTFTTTFTNNGKITGKDYTGGVVGYLRDYRSVGYNNCYHTVRINNWQNAGDVVGERFTAGVLGYILVNADHSGSYTSVIKMTLASLTSAANVTGTSYVGGIIGYAESNDSSSTISECSSSGVITAEYYLGGLAGRLQNVSLSDSSNEGTTVVSTGYYIDGSNYNVWLGGYVGYGYRIENCTNKSDIVYTERGFKVGGVAGVATGIVANCGNEGNITANKASYVGGIVGYIDYAGDAPLNLLTNDGDISGVSYVGGIFGYVRDYRSVGYNNCDNTFSMTRCTNGGDITATGSYAGGMVGSMQLWADHSGSYTSVIKLNAVNLTSEGDVTAGESYAGGLFGYAYSNNAASVVKDSSSKGIITAGYIVGGIAGKLENVQLTDSTNEGSTVVATSYQTDGTNYNAYLGGYCGIGYYVENCENDVDITYTERGRFVGGIIGYQQGGGVLDCTNRGDISATKSDYVGGIFGYANYAGSLTLKNLENGGAIVGNNYVGGIIGYVYDYRSVGYNNCSETLMLSKVTNGGAVQGNSYIGGIVGYARAYADHSGSYTSVIMITTQTATNTAAITGTGDYIGGIYGYAYSNNSSSRIIAPVATGTVTSTGAGTNVGDVAGKLENITVID